MTKPGPERSEMRKAAEAAGFSRSQMYRAIAVASIPEEDFEELVESEEPATVTELVRHGRGTEDKPRPRRLRRCPHCGESLEVAP